MYKPIPNFNGYFISEHGEVIAGGVAIKPHPNNRGYLRVFMSNSNGRTSRQIHRLVAQAYIPIPDNLPVVNHKDGDKHNNDVSNLEWVSYRENSQHALTLGKRERRPVACVNPKTGTVRAPQSWCYVEE